MSAINYPVDEIRLGLFMSQAKIRQQQDALKQRIRRHVADGGYVLFRNSSLYLLKEGKVAGMFGTKDNYKQADFLRFDGQRVSRLNPEYYLGPASIIAFIAARQNDDPILDADTINIGGSDGSNNNNNNNGNNGNNG
jgi:hypothetical protein